MRGTVQREVLLQTNGSGQRGAGLPWRLESLFIGGTSVRLCCPTRSDQGIVLDRRYRAGFGPMTHFESAARAGSGFGLVWRKLAFDLLRQVPPKQFMVGVRQAARLGVPGCEPCGCSVNGRGLHGFANWI